MLVADYETMAFQSNGQTMCGRSGKTRFVDQLAEGGRP